MLRGCRHEQTGWWLRHAPPRPQLDLISTFNRRLTFDLTFDVIGPGIHISNHEIVTLTEDVALTMLPWQRKGKSQWKQTISLVFGLR